MDSASPLRRSSTTRPSTCEGRILSSVSRAIELPKTCVRATPAYMTLVVCLRSDACNEVSIQCCAKAAMVCRRSLAGRPPLTRPRIAAAFSRASCGVPP